MDDLEGDMSKVIIQEHNNKLQQIDHNLLDKKMVGLHPLTKKEGKMQRGIRCHKHLHLEFPSPGERLFTNWSSEDSPRERVTQCVQSARSVETNRTVNQAEQTARDIEDNEVLRYVLSDVTTTPSAQIQISQVGARFIDRETNTSEVEIRPPGEEVRIDIDHAHSRGIQVPSSHSELSSHNTNIAEGPLAQLHIPDLYKKKKTCTRS